ncbi:hypothetical protein FM036_20275 [Nostoc sp. HG1]|nr:hypothetical protein [Nostoc sp. HG1]
MVEIVTKNQQISLNELWESASICDRVFYPELLTDLPDLARRYLEQAIAPGTQLASAVRLWMHGDIKLGQKWHPFKGEEVICWNRGMIWKATTWMQGLPIWGADRVVDGVSNMQWKILGLFPVMKASGDDITRSGVGRVQGESVWLPSVFCNLDISWMELGASKVQANFTTLSEPAKLTLTVNDRGMLKQVKFHRWGNPQGGEFHYVDFGGIIEESGTFGGYTIPTRLRLGWFFESDRFESEGEFFRCTIDKAVYR